jgi:hypothetical protein
LGEISLECSRPGAAAAALWATQKLLPLQRGGEFGQGLERSRRAAMALHRKLHDSDGFVPGFSPELDIVVFAPKASRVPQMSARSREIFAQAAKLGLHLALAELPIQFFPALEPHVAREGGTITALRSVLMKPVHLDWVERIWVLLQAAAVESGNRAGKPI